MIFNPFSTHSGRLQASLSMTEEKQTRNFRALPSVLLALWLSFCDSGWAGMKVLGLAWAAPPAGKKNKVIAKNRETV